MVTLLVVFLKCDPHCAESLVPSQYADGHCNGYSHVHVLKQTGLSYVFNGLGRVDHATHQGLSVSVIFSSIKCKINGEQCPSKVHRTQGDV